MGHLRQLHLCAAGLFALLALLLYIPRADALTVAYDQNYGTAYVNVLRRASVEPLEAQGYARRLLELFQDRRADAVEVYDFQA